MTFIFVSHTTKNAPRTNFSMASGINIGVSPPTKFIPTTIHRRKREQTLRVASFSGPRRGAPTHSCDRIAVPVLRHISTPDQKMGLKATLYERCCRGGGGLLTGIDDRRSAIRGWLLSHDILRRDFKPQPPQSKQ